MANKDKRGGDDGLSEKNVQLLRKTYYDPADSGSYSTATNLYKSIKKKGNDSISMRQISDWLLGQGTHTKNKRPRTHFMRRQVVKLYPMDIFCLDLIDTQSIRAQNNNFGYILCVMDLFSRMAFVRPLHRKTMKETWGGLESIFNELQDYPRACWSDNGSEIVSCYKKMDELGIHHYTVNSPLKCSVIERYNLTLEMKLFQYMTARHTVRYIDALQDIVKGINERPSRALFGLSPDTVFHNVESQNWLKNKYKQEKEVHDKKATRLDKNGIQIQKGDWVRVREKVTKFERGYKPKFGATVHRVLRRLNTKPATYRVTDIARSLYRPELSLVKPRPATESNIYDFYDKERQVDGKKLRSGKKFAKITQRLKKNFNDPTQSSWE